MAEVKLRKLYKVFVIEYDMGTQRIDPNDTKFFTTLDEAVTYSKEWETDRECYYKATIEKVA